MPGAGNVEDEQAAEKSQSQHGRAAVHSLHPKFCRMRANSELSAPLSKMMQPGPGGAAHEDESEDDVNRPFMLPAKPDRTAFHLHSIIRTPQTSR